MVYSWPLVLSCRLFHDTWTKTVYKAPSLSFSTVSWQETALKNNAALGSLYTSYLGSLPDFSVLWFVRNSEFRNEEFMFS